MQKLLAGGVTAVVIGFILWLFLVYGGTSVPVPIAVGEPIATVQYRCDQGKTIDASYFQGESKPPATPGQPPRPGGSVKVVLSDGRTMNLRQTISADGVRYSNGDPQKAGSETFVFWSRGHAATVLEGNQQQTYSGCIEVAEDPGGLPGVYESGTRGFSIRYPAGYAVDDSYNYSEMGPGKGIEGVKFTVSSSTVVGTNLAPDTYLSVEDIPFTDSASSTCSASLFLSGNRYEATSTSDTGVEYSFATSSGAAAGNRYDETVYALPGTNPCIGVRYFVHYRVLQNYPPGAVLPFDAQQLRSQFDVMRDTLMMQQ